MLAARAGRLITRLRQRRWKTAGAVWTHTDGRSFLATPVEQFRSTDALRLSLDHVVTALEAAEVEHHILTAPPETPRILVKDLSPALAALRQDPSAWYTQTRGRSTLLRSTRSAEGAASGRVFRVWATASGQFLAGADVAVEFITNAAPTMPGAAPHFPIDAVFTWVDGADPLWQQRKRARRAGVTGPLHETADNDARYESLDELRYALRSIEMYAPWIRRIFLVTDQQVPAWFNLKNPGVIIVDHRDIFGDPTDLPTFNSHAIEACLHHIPGLAEHYIYFNDDVFLTRTLPPSFFFTAAGDPRVFLAADGIDGGPRVATDAPVVAAAKNNRDLLRHLANYELRHRLKHVPHPQLRSLAHELESRSPKAFSATTGAPFRSPHDLSVASSLLPHYALARGRGSRGLVEHFYADVASPELRWRLPLFSEQRRADVVCLNATTSRSPSTTLLQQLLDQTFPVPSPSETANARDAPVS